MVVEGRVDGVVVAIIGRRGAEGNGGEQWFWIMNCCC